MELTIVDKLYLEVLAHLCNQTRRSEMMPRDWFAGMALQSLLNRFPPPEYSCSTTAAMAYIVADAMVAEREKHAKVPQSESIT